jgi:hypothetical protein
VSEKKSEFFSIKANFRSLMIVLVFIAIAGWYFGFNKDDVGDLAKTFVTMHKPELPIEVQYRKSMLGKGYVVILNNTLNNPISVNVTLRAAAQNKQKKSGLIGLEASSNVSIGWMEGWEFKPGDAITISHDDYQTDTVKIPASS